MASEDILTSVLDTLHARCVLAGHRSGSGDWLIQSPAPGRVKVLAVTRGRIAFRLRGESRWLEVGAGEAVVLDGQSSFEFGPQREMTPTPAVADEITSPISADDDTVCITAHIDFRGAYSLFLRGAIPPLTHISSSSNAGVAVGWLVRQLDVEMKNQLPASSRASSYILETLLVYVMREWLSSGMRLPPGWLRLFADPLLAPAVGLIHQEMRFDLSVGDLARSCRLSRTVFIEKFRKSAGIPPASYILGWKMQVAMELLEKTSTSIDQIASDLSYSSASAFSVAFKRSMGRTPGSVRTARYAV